MTDVEHRAVITGPAGAAGRQVRLTQSGRYAPFEMRFANRTEAGRAIAAALAPLDLRDPVIYGIPRGGVIVAAEVPGEHDVIVTRKIGAPGQPELGLGAVTATGAPVLDEALVRLTNASPGYLEAEIERERAEARRRVEAFGGRGVDPAGRDAVVVDDGIATGGTAIAAAHALRAQQPARLILAVPVAPEPAIERLRELYDEVIVLESPRDFAAVGQWYVDFHQVGDDEVRQAL